MKKLKEDWFVATLMENLEENTVSFDYPIQRKGEQWDDVQKSLLIHSIIEDYPIPSLFSIVEKETRKNSSDEDYEVEVYYILDGKQRLTNIRDFIIGEYSLHEQTPTTFLNGEEIVLAGLSYKDLPDKLKNKIQKCELQMYRLVDATEEQIEDIFFRLQNGTPLTKQQQGKAKMGSAWAERFTKLCAEHPALIQNAKFTKLQIRKADDELTVIQTMMLLDDKYELKSISSNDAFDYAVSLRDNEYRTEIYNRVVEGLDYIHEAFGDVTEKFLLKKVHMPMAIITALHAKDLGIAPIRYRDWVSEFEASYKGVTKNYIKTEYKKHSGQGSVKANKAKGRIEEMIKHFDTYINRPLENKEDELKSVVDELKKEIDNPSEDDVNVYNADDASNPSEEKNVDTTEETATTETATEETATEETATTETATTETATTETATTETATEETATTETATEETATTETATTETEMTIEIEPTIEDSEAKPTTRRGKGRNNKVTDLFNS